VAGHENPAIIIDRRDLLEKECHTDVLLFPRGKKEDVPIVKDSFGRNVLVSLDGLCGPRLGADRQLKWKTVLSTESASNRD
jgi:hypothetical protein